MIFFEGENKFTWKKSWLVVGYLTTLFWETIFDDNLLKMMILHNIFENKFNIWKAESTGIEEISMHGCYWANVNGQSVVKGCVESVKSSQSKG